MAEAENTKRPTRELTDVEKFIAERARTEGIDIDFEYRTVDFRGQKATWELIALVSTTLSALDWIEEWEAARQSARSE